MTTFRTAVPPIVRPEVLFEIEDALGTPLFAGVPVGSTLGDIYTTELRLGQGDWRVRSALRECLFSGYHWLRGISLGGKGADLPPERVLLTWLGERQSLRDMVLPLVHAIGPEKCNVIGATRDMAAQLPSETGFATFDALPAIDLVQWRQTYGRCAREWAARLRHVLRRNGAPQIIAPRLAHMMLVQSQRVMSGQAFLDRVRPTAVVTEADRHLQAACLVLAARTRGVPTMTMIHGAINPPYGYTPLLADWAFCWGEQHRSQMMAMGVESERLVITGCQRLTRTVSADPALARAKAGLPGDRPVALLATNPIQPAHRRQIVHAFCEGMGGVEGVTAAVRLHPSEDMAFYNAQIVAFPRVHFMANHTWSLDEALAAVDLVVCHDSTFGSEALVKGRLVVVLDVLPVSLGNGKTLIEQAGAPRACSASELSAIIKRLFTDAAWREILKTQGEEYVRYSCAAFGDEAADNIARLVLARSEAPADLERHSV